MTKQLKDASESAEEEFPFKIFYDKGGLSGSAPGVSKVPMKVFVEGGVIRKA